jgi:hypothetical protein
VSAGNQYREKPLQHRGKVDGNTEGTEASGSEQNEIKIDPVFKYLVNSFQKKMRAGMGRY